mmetsp:Transcript_12072/g.34183  ORF Transcript_12072/g.34183 Transcript_12072/m.34183 type:complete len:712 (+) Transcript_12072:1427-3562(+)
MIELASPDQQPKGRSSRTQSVPPEIASDGPGQPASERREGRETPADGGPATEPLDLREWQHVLLTVFKEAILPATRPLYDLAVRKGVDTHDQASLETALQDYYKSISRPKLHASEIVWGVDEKKIETFLVSPPLEDGRRFLRAQYQAATGAGKTRSMVEMIKAHMESNVRVDDMRPPLYVVVEPTINLVKQTYESLKEVDGLYCFCVCSDDTIGEKKNKEESISYIERRGKPTAIVTTKNSSAGTKTSPGLLDLFTERAVVAELLLLDESHMLAGDSGGKIQKETYVKNAGAAMLKISFTATPTAAPVSNECNEFHPNSDGASSESFFCQNDLRGVFGPAICRYEYGHALKDSVVAPLQLQLLDNSVPGSDTVLSNFLVGLLTLWDKENKKWEGGEWPKLASGKCIDPLDASTVRQRSSDEQSWRCERLLMVCKIIHEIAIGNQSHVLAFCLWIPRAKKCSKLVKFVCHQMITMVESADNGSSPFKYQRGSPELERLLLLEQNCYYDVSGSASCSSGKNGIVPFKNSKIGFLANIDRVVVGSDIPCITGIWFVDIKAPTNPQKLTQAIGRGTRIAPEKRGCVVFLPCFVPDAQLTVSIESKTKKTEETLGKLQEKARQNTWVGSFSKMALHLYDFLERSQSEGCDLKVECVRSSSIHTSQGDPKTSNSGFKKHSGLYGSSMQFKSKGASEAKVPPTPDRTGPDPNRSLKSR